MKSAKRVTRAACRHHSNALARVLGGERSSSNHTMRGTLASAARARRTPSKTFAADAKTPSSSAVCVINMGAGIGRAVAA
eukprot:2070340-Pyramimonas_sp.AAC.1